MFYDTRSGRALPVITVTAATPSCLLISETAGDSCGPDGDGRWKIAIRDEAGQQQFAVEDLEPGTTGERLELLSVVRGLEAIDQPSQVTLVTSSSYVSRGLRFGLEKWREDNWKWERFGEVVPVKNDDLWQRVDRAMRYHKVECRTWRVDQPHVGPRLAVPQRSTVAETAIRAGIRNLWRESSRAINHVFDGLGYVLTISQRSIARLITGIAKPVAADGTASNLVAKRTYSHRVASTPKPSQKKYDTDPILPRMAG